MPDATPTKRRLTPRGSKAKGDGYEREVAAFFDERLAGGSGRVRRAIMSGGGRNCMGAGGADIEGLPGLHVEAKRTETLRPHEALRQAEASVSARGSADVPVVVARRSRVATGDSLVVMRLSAFTALYEALMRRQP